MEGKSAGVASAGGRNSGVREQLRGSAAVLDYSSDVDHIHSDRRGCAAGIHKRYLALRRQAAAFLNSHGYRPTPELIDSEFDRQWYRLSDEMLASSDHLS